MAARGDDLFAAIEAIHSAALDESLWPQALAGIAACFGGRAASIEVFEKRSLRPRELYTAGVPPPAEMKYLDQYFALNRRLPVAARGRLGDLLWDYHVFDEATIRRDPFYMEFLRELGLRYFVGGLITSDGGEFAGVCVHFSPRQGHVGMDGIKLMQRLLPHARGAFDVARRLRRSAAARHSLERALDWLADGVALISGEGLVVYANDALQAMARRHDGLSLKGGRIEIASPEARLRLGAAVAAASRCLCGEEHAVGMDFPVPRPSNSPPYILAVRPLRDGGRSIRTTASASAMVFVHDPVGSRTNTVRLIREIFELTEAEAALSSALKAGVAPSAYARQHALSLNTVYTHLRRIKDKTGCRRTPELVRKLNEVNVPLRAD